MSTLDIQAMSSQQHNTNGGPPATLEFKQAMKDFKTMFPTLDMELIECVLRSNSGRVDATIDQLLQLSKDSGHRNSSRRQNRYHTGHIAVDYDSTDSEDSFHSEFLDGPTSSDDNLNLRDPPPMYTPHAEDPIELSAVPSYPADACATHSKQFRRGNSPHHFSNGNKTKKRYRTWNPPMLGTLPDDFLRILPQQFLDHKEKPKLQKSLSHPQRRQFVSKPVLKSLVSTNDPVAISQAFGIDTAHAERTGPQPGLTGPAIDNGFGDGIGDHFDAMTPPPRPPRAIPVHQSRRSTTAHLSDCNDHSNSMIRTGSECHHRHVESSNNPRRSRHHHSHLSRTSRQPQSSRNHSFQSRRCTNNCNHTRKSNDFTSRRMVMVSRLSEPALPISHNGISNGVDNIHTPSSNNIRTHHATSSRNSSSHITSHNRDSPNSFRNELQWHPAQSRLSHRPSSTNSVRSRPRTSVEEEQYVEDCRLAILLQNEEFIRELKRNDEFLKELEKDRPDGTHQPAREDRDKEIFASPDPDGKYTHGSHEGNALEGVSKLAEDIEKDDKAFKENLKHMSKSARKKFNELAKRFSVKRRSSYKTMKNIDPVFADCDDEFERRRSTSPTFNL